MSSFWYKYLCGAQSIWWRKAALAAIGTPPRRLKLAEQEHGLLADRTGVVDGATIGSSHWRHLPRAAAICKGLESALPLDRVVRGLCLTVICVTFQSCYPDLCISSEKRRKFHVD